MGQSNPKLVVIGWQGANWKSIHPLVDAGLMPNLRSLIEGGSIGKVKASGPGDPAILWTSIATGTTADKHGILSALEADPMSGAPRLAHGARRKVKAVWNIAMQSGLTAHVAGWYAASPAEELNGSSVTNEFVIPTAPGGAPWAILNGTIHPEQLAETAAQQRMHPSELRIADLHTFIPSLAAIDRDKDRRAWALADILAREISMHSIATWLLENRPWNLMMIGWHALGRACQRFMQYTAPRMEHVSQQDCATYGEVVNATYQFHDMLLGRLLELAGPDANFMLVAPAAYRTGAERPTSPVVQRLPGAWYMPYGVFCMSGPNIVQDHLVHGVKALDIAPTILATLGLAAGSDMPGRVIEEVFVQPPPMERIASWEKVAGDCGRGPGESEEEAAAAEAAIAELLGEGYTEPPRPTGFAAVVRREKLVNSILVHLAAGRYNDARPHLIELAAENPADLRIRLWLAHCHIVCGDREACRMAIQDLPREGAAGALVALLMAHVEFLDGHADKARAALAQAETAGADLAIVNYAAGVMYMLTSSSQQAERMLRRAIDLDPAFQAAHNMLAGLLSRRGDTAQAVDFARGSLEIDYASAFSHFALGLAMVGARDGDQAIQAFENSLAFDPNLRQARSWVVALRAEKQSRGLSSFAPVETQT